jgi:hypothetical protein
MTVMDDGCTSKLLNFYSKRCQISEQVLYTKSVRGLELAKVKGLWAL